VLAELAKCVDYMKCEPVVSLLPNTLRRVSSHDAKDVAEWQERIARVAQGMSPVSATERYWLELLDELYKAARQRLEELDGTEHAGSQESRSGLTTSTLRHRS
jgi:hypothetical protein